MEESVGSGVRRIEAVTGAKAYQSLIHEKQTVDTIVNVLKIKNRKEVVTKVESNIAEIGLLKKEVEKLTSKMNALTAANKVNDVEVINGINVLYVEEKMESAKAKQMAFDFRDKMKSGIVVLVTTDNDKCSYFVALTKDIVETGKKAGDIVKSINVVVDGRGGGKPDFAQGGCSLSDKVTSLKKALKDIL